DLIECVFGLLLTISKMLVELQGGKLQFISTLGEGSIFTFSLPIAKSSTMAEVSTGYQQASPSVEPIGTNVVTAENVSKANEGKTSSTRIIVVDDDSVNLQVVETVLSNEAYELTTVLNPRSEEH